MNFMFLGIYYWMEILLNISNIYRLICLFKVILLDNFSIHDYFKLAINKYYSINFIADNVKLHKSKIRMQVGSLRDKYIPIGAINFKSCRFIKMISCIVCIKKIYDYCLFPSYIPCKLLIFYPLFDVKHGPLNCLITC